MGAPDFRQFQHAFARYLRDPRGTPPPAGVPPRRAAVYAGLLFNNVSGFLDSCLPVCRETLGEARWRRLQRRFWREAALHSPLHRDIPRECVRWLQAGGASGQPRWLPDLAHYEWAELAVDLMDVETPPHDAAGDLLRAPVAVNPVHLNLRYDWPVQRIGPAYRPRKPQPTQLLVWRDAHDAVQFMQLNAVSARLLALLAAAPTTGEAACRQVAAELRYPDPDHLLAHGAALLEQWRAQGILLGTHT
jgi:hypothetical protein